MSHGNATPADLMAPWWKEITRNQWYALLAGKIGWMLDAFDVMLYVFCLKTIMDEWHLNPAVAGFMVTVTLFASSFGGIIFGAVADRFGRKKALMATVLIFSICSGLSGLSQNLFQLAIARTILGLGMGGEWASGALLVSETWPAKHRGKAIGLMQGGWALGYIAAAIAAATILPRFGWRVMFFVGVIPALFALWIRTKVEEPAVWVAQHQKEKAEPKSKGGFLQKLDNTKDVDGKSILDNSMIMYGCGNGDGNAHTHANLPILLAGGGGGSLNGGRYVKHPNVPLTNLYLSMMDRMMGDSQRIERFADSTGRLVNI